MAETKIEWTATPRGDGTFTPGYTFNPWIGCAKVHTGCTHCYAESFAKRYNKAAWGPNGTRVKTSDSYWRQPLKWNRDVEQEAHEMRAAAGGVGSPFPNDEWRLFLARRRVFCASLADVFEDWQGPIVDHKGNTLRSPLASFGPLAQAPVRQVAMDDLRLALFDLIDATPHLDWLLLTKRPENIRRMWPPKQHSSKRAPQGNPRPNVWIGTSISCRDLAPVLFLSIEPLLGPVDLTHIGPEDHDVLCGWKAKANNDRGWANTSRVDWIIVGGESGPQARPCDLAWISLLVAECQASETPCFVKQIGSRPQITLTREQIFNSTVPLTNVGSRLNDSKGGDPSEWPEYLQVREFPEARR